MKTDNALPLMGLALRAGRLEAGEEPVATACAARRCRLTRTPPEKLCAVPPVSRRRDSASPFPSPIPKRRLGPLWAAPPAP